MKLLPLFALFVCSVTLSIVTAPTHAASPVPSHAQINEITENLKNRLKETISTVESVEDGGKVTPRAYVGKVRDIVQNTIVIDDKTGKKNIVIGDGAEILRTPGNSTIKIENVAITDSIIAIGYPQEGDDLDGKRIVVSSVAFTPPQKSSGLATISKLSKNSISATPSGTSTTKVLTVNTKSIYKTPTGVVEFSDLAVGDKIVYTALVDAKDPDLMTATVIMQIQAATPAESPVASPKSSAKPSASPAVSSRPSPSI